MLELVHGVAAAKPEGLAAPKHLLAW